MNDTCKDLTHAAALAPAVRGEVHSQERLAMRAEAHFSCHRLQGTVQTRTKHWRTERREGVECRPEGDLAMVRDAF